MRKWFVVILIFFSKSLFAQYVLLESFSSTAILVESKGLGSGSGFYLTDSSAIYFITASHVIYDGKRNELPDTIILISYRQNAEIDSPDTLIIDVAAAYKSRNLIIDLINDVAVLKIGIVKKIDSTYNKINYYDYAIRGRNTKISSTPVKDVADLNEITIGSDVIMFGYPKSLNLKFRFDFNRPLLRKGFVAGRNFKEQKVIIDCASYQGNSGGPVFNIIFNNGVPQPKIIGIVTEFIPFVEYWSNENYTGVKNMSISNSGYSVVTPLGIVIPLLDKLRE